jgi:hypothetical protein
MGLLGLNAALAAAAIAGDGLLGHLWWLALIGLLVSSLAAGAALFVRAENVGLDLTTNLELAEEVNEEQMNQAIAESLSQAVDINEVQLGGKSDRVLVALVLLLATIGGAIIGVWVF